MTKQEQIDLAEKLQALLLKDFERRLLDDDMTPTDRATLARLLQQNGWVLDPAQLPQGIESKLTEDVNPEDFDEDDIYDIRRAMGVG